MPNMFHKFANPARFFRMAAAVGGRAHGLAELAVVAHVDDALDSGVPSFRAG